MSGVEFRNLSKNYGPVAVIRGLNLSINEGEFVALVGPSGCGKSTTLRMVAGLERATGGDILINGQRVNEWEPKQRNIAMVFQNYALYPHMTVRQNIGLNLKISGIAKAVVARRVEEAAALLEIEPLLERMPSQLSGGQRQRVAMGRAIVRNPSVFLFDEPLSNLDALLRVQMRGEIKRFHKKTGRTTIYVTHDQIEAMTLADRVVVMHKGDIIQAGSPEDLYERPSSTFVAGFIGSPRMNLIPAEIETSSAGGTSVTLPGGQRLALSAPLAAHAERKIIVGMRPEHFSLGTQGQPIEAKVTLIEFTGAFAIVTLDMGGAEITCQFDNRHGLREGEMATVSIPESRLHFFDSETGQRIG